MDDVAELEVYPQDKIDQSHFLKVLHLFGFHKRHST